MEQTPIKPPGSQEIKAKIKALKASLQFPKRSSRYRRLLKEYDETLMRECFARTRQSLIDDMESGKIPDPNDLVRQMYQHNPNPIF
jgi:hypothetical protein